MVRRLFWGCLPLLLTQISWAGDVAWNCQQDKDSKEWVCMGDKKSANRTDSATKARISQPEAKPAEFSVVKPIVQTEPIKRVDPVVAPVTKAVQASQPPVAPVVTKVDKPTPLESAAEPINSTAAKVTETKANVLDVAPKVEPPPVEASQAASTAAASAAPAAAPVASDSPVTAPAEGVATAEKTTAESETSTVEASSEPAAEPAPGWYCGANGGKEGWKCKLVGADPKLAGENPKATPTTAKSESKGFGFSLLDPVFDRQEEAVFANLNDRFPVDPWAGCGVETTPKRPDATGKKEREASPLDLNSNYSEMFDNEVGSYFGDVDIKRADQRASAHAAHYDSVADTLDLHGNVFYSEDEIGVYTDSATLKLGSDQARLRDALFISPSTPIRGRAKAMYRDSASFSRFSDAAYTTCRPGNQDWAVHASELKLNKETGKGAAKHAWVEFKGFPVFYSPYLSFPMDDRRQTGFLAPVFGNTRSNGFDIATPFYWNIAPNYDATLRPRYLLERGILLGGDFRYLTESSHGTLSGEILPNDGKSAGNSNANNGTVGTAEKNSNPNYDKARYQFSFNNFTRFTPKISSTLDLNYVSDKNYFSDLGNSLSFSNFRYIKSFADLKYIDDGISLTAQLVNYQRVDESLTGRKIPYRKLPQINLALDHAFENLPVPLYTELDSEYVYFQHIDSVAPPTLLPQQPIGGGPISSDGVLSLPQGQRFNIKPSVSLPLKTDYAYVTPKASLQYTQYLLDNQGDLNPSSISRVLPILSVDSGLYLERDMNIMGSALKHTLEPRLFYLYIPKTDQRDIPLFDTAPYDFRYSSMFRENRFSGIDRMQDANQLTLALTSRFLDSATGLERLKLNIGSILYLQDRDVSLAYWDQVGVEQNAKPEKTAFQHQRFSNVVAEATSQLNKHISADTGIQWNPRTNHIERGNIGLHFVNQPGELVNLAFQYRRDESKCRISDVTTPGCEYAKKTSIDPNDDAIGNDIILSDASFRWPIYDDWYGIGRWQYSWLYGRTQEAFLGLEKENCCWRFRIIGRRYFNGLTNPSASSGGRIDLNTAEAQTGVFFQIELKGLTGFGQKLDDFFERNIYGYQKPQH